MLMPSAAFVARNRARHLRPMLRRQPQCRVISAVAALDPLADVSEHAARGVNLRLIVLC